MLFVYRKSFSYKLCSHFFGLKTPGAHQAERKGMGYAARVGKGDTSVTERYKRKDTNEKVHILRGRPVCDFSGFEKKEFSERTRLETYGENIDTKYLVFLGHVPARVNWTFHYTGTGRGYHLMSYRKHKLQWACLTYDCKQNIVLGMTSLCFACAWKSPSSSCGSRVLSRTISGVPGNYVSMNIGRLLEIMWQNAIDVL